MNGASLDPEWIGSIEVSSHSLYRSRMLMPVTVWLEDLKAGKWFIGIEGLDERFTHIDADTLDEAKAKAIAWVREGAP